MSNKSKEGRVSFVAPLQLMAADDVEQEIDSARLEKIKETDPHPCFAQLRVGHEGIARQASPDEGGYMDAPWVAGAIQTLADCFQPPRHQPDVGRKPVYWLHGDPDDHKRKKVGSVESGRVRVGRHGLEALSIIYLSPGEIRDKAKQGIVDICSPEVSARCEYDVTGCPEIVTVQRATGLALGSTSQGHTPGFPQAGFLSTFQMFAAEGNTNTQNADEGIPKVKTAAEWLKETKNMIDDGTLTESDITRSPVIKGMIERTVARDVEKAGSTDAALKKTNDELQAKLDTANARIGDMEYKAKLPDLVETTLQEVAGGKHNLTAEQVGNIVKGVSKRTFTGDEKERAEQLKDAVSDFTAFLDLQKKADAQNTQGTASPAPAGTQGASQSNGQQTQGQQAHTGKPTSMVAEEIQKLEELSSGPSHT